MTNQTSKNEQKILIVNNQENYHSLAVKLTKVVDSLGVTSVTLNSRDTISLERLATFNGIILSGSPRDLTQPVAMEGLKLNLQVMLERRVPLLGICGGMQLLSLSYGARLGKWKKLQEGMRTIRIVDAYSPLFTDLPETISVYEGHQEYVIEPPPGFKLIATSTTDSPEHECKVQGIQNNNWPIYGTQFHPELSGETGKKILSNFFSICGN